MIKKPFVFLLVFIMFFIPLNTRADSEIKGFEKNYNELFMRNYFTDEEFEKMEQDFAELFDKDIWPDLLESFSARGGWETSPFTPEAEYIHRYNTYKPDFDYAIRVSVLNHDFLCEYAKQNCMSYLFVGDYFQALKGKYNNEYSLDGRRIQSHYVFKPYDQGFSRDERFFEYFERENLIKLMTEKNITEVIDMKVFGLANRSSFLYIQTPDAEYLLKLYPYENNYANINGIWERVNIENNKLYDAKEVILNPEVIDFCDWMNKETVLRNKDFYETEALSLQKEGLLKGNEKGLDLMKPLTRIEAATMLLRAIGEDTATGGVQAFSDVPSYHWGFSAASKAQELGIVKGIGNNMFAPDRIVSVTEFSTMVLRAAEYGDFDWQKATDILVEKGILTEEQTATMDWFTRGDMAKIIYEARAKGLLH